MTKSVINEMVVTKSSTTKNERMSAISPKPETISTIVRSYKSVVSKNARFIDKNFGWQTRFHDHIIRNAHSFEIIQNYIATNAQNWEKDKFAMQLVDLKLQHRST